MKFQRLLEIINKDKLFFPHIKCMSDKWEGLLTKRTEEKLYQLEYAKYNDSKTASESVKQYVEHKNAFFINCWHMNMNESYLMWKVYGDRECAIQTTYERLVVALDNTSAEINGGVVKYIDYERERFPLGNIFWAVSHKDLPYMDEKEFRLFYWKSSRINQNYQVEKNGVEVAINTDILIEKIYINPKPFIDVNKLSEAINKKSLSCEIKTTKIKQ